jgi:hypothetical protein
MPYTHNDFGFEILSREQILGYLNGTSRWAANQRAEDMKDPELRSHIADPETYAAAETVFTETLRSYMSDWIDSGKKSGYEIPETRSLWSIENGESKAELAMQEYIERNPPQTFSHGTGIETVFIAPKGYMFDSPLEFAKEDATRVLVNLMNSDDKWQIAQCVVCREYLFPERKLREIYVRGIHHARCRPQIAMLDTRASREAWAEKILDLAAQAWPKHKSFHGTKERWVAAQVNDRLGPSDKHITMTWITRNIGKIESRVRENAKKA